jgi:hypothetical protein
VIKHGAILARGAATVQERGEEQDRLDVQDVDDGRLPILDP